MTSIMTQETNSSTLAKNPIPSLTILSSSTSMSLASPSPISPEPFYTFDPIESDPAKIISSKSSFSTTRTTATTATATTSATEIDNSQTILKQTALALSEDASPTVQVTQNSSFSTSTLISSSSSTRSTPAPSIRGIVPDNSTKQFTSLLSGQSQGREVIAKSHQTTSSISAQFPSINNLNMYSYNNNYTNGALRNPSISSGNGASSTVASSATPTMSSTLNGGSVTGVPASGVSDVKLKRFLEHNQRLKEQLEMSRISVSEASTSLIKYVTGTKDSLLPTLWGSAPSDPFSKQSSGCCTIS